MAFKRPKATRAIVVALDISKALTRFGTLVFFTSSSLVEFPTLFLLYISDLPDEFTCNVVIHADDTTL